MLHYRINRQLTSWLLLLSTILTVVITVNIYYQEEASPSYHNPAQQSINSHDRSTQIKDSSYSSSNILPFIRLTGTFISESNKLAFISINDNNERPYVISETLLNSYRIIEIENNYIIIQSNAEPIRINTSNSNKVVNSIATPTYPYLFSDKLDTYINGRSLASVEFPIGVKSTGISQIGDNYFKLNRTLINDQIHNKHALRHIKIDFSESKIKITEIVPGSFFDIGGLLPGDKITEINQIPIHSFFDLLNIYSRLDSTDSLNISLIRNNENQNLIYELVN